MQVSAPVVVQDLVGVCTVLTVYLVMAAPPFEAGAFQVTVTDPFPDVPTTEVGAPDTEVRTIWCPFGLAAVEFKGVATSPSTAASDAKTTPKDFNISTTFAFA